MERSRKVFNVQQFLWPDASSCRYHQLLHLPSCREKEKQSQQQIRLSTNELCSPPFPLPYHLQDVGGEGGGYGGEGRCRAQPIIP